MLKECQSTKSSDNAQILMQLRAEVIICWEDIKWGICLYLCLQWFKRLFLMNINLLSTNKVIIKNDDNELLWDKLLANDKFINNGKINLIGQDIDCEIKDEWINKLFYYLQEKR